MAFIEGGNNPGHRTSVTATGQLNTTATQISAQTEASIAGDAYNVNSGLFNLTSDVETPIAFFKNDTEDRDIIIDAMVLSICDSVGGSGELTARIIADPTGGTILTGGTDRVVANLNLSSRKTLGVTATDGATGLTFSGGEDVFHFFFPVDNTNHNLVFESLVLPRGASFIITLTPPAGNTSLPILTGISAYLKDSQ